MALRLQELQQREAMVNADGTPSQYFLRYLKARGGALTDLEAELIIKADKTTQILAGAGLTGGGDLSADRTLTVDEQAVLDAIATTQGAVLYRGATDWAALAPGTAGQVLQTGGTGANPSWATASGGGGDRTLLATLTPASGVISSLGNTYTGYKRIDLEIFGIETDADAQIQLQLEVAASLVTTGYKYATRTISTSATDNAISSTSSATIALTGTVAAAYALGGGAGKSLSGFLRLFMPVAGTYKEVIGDVSLNFTGTNHGRANVAGSLENTGSLTGFKLLPSTGNIDVGTVKVWGVS